MRPALRLLNTSNIPGIQGGAGLWKSGHPGVHVWRRPQKYEVFRSKFGPQYKIPFHVYGLDAHKLKYIASVAAGLGVTAGTFALFFFDAVPKVKQDILSKLPFIGQYFIDEIPPEDNPF